MTDLPRLYAPDAEIAAMLGRSKAWLYDNAENLERQFSFPRKDPAIGMRHIPSILKWAESRNARPVQATTPIRREDDGF